jgi:hypothetical protein
VEALAKSFYGIQDVALIKTTGLDRKSCCSFASGTAAFMFPVLRLERNL